MKKIVTLSVFAFALTAFTVLSTWKVDNAHSSLRFSITHMGIADVSGQFKKFDVNITSSSDDFSDAVFELTADASSIDTEVEARDNHLRSADFFDAAKYPTIHFKSNSIKPADEKNKYVLSGNLTMHGVTKPVSMELFYRGTIENPMNKKPTAGFKVKGTIKRSDFAIGGGFPAPMLSDEVRIEADGEFVKN